MGRFRLATGFAANGGSGGMNGTGHRPRISRICAFVLP